MELIEIVNDLQKRIAQPEKEVAELRETAQPKNDGIIISVSESQPTLYRRVTRDECGNFTSEIFTKNSQD